jgi:hypothetical protein
MTYQLNGSLLEVCSCRAICPCWVGEDPDGGRCKGTIAYRVDDGTIDGLDVSGLTLGLLADIPGNALDGNWKVAIFVDDRATAKQEEALLAAFTGKKGGPLADVAQVVGEVVSVERATIDADIQEGTGLLRIGDMMSAEMESLKGSNGKPTKLYDTVFSFREGAPAFPGKAATYRVTCPSLGMELEMRQHNAIQGAFSFSA